MAKITPPAAKVDLSRVARPFPAHNLKEAMIVITAIAEQNASRPMDRLLVARAINRTPASSEFRLLLSSSNKYGLTIGNEKSDAITPTELGLKIVKPMDNSEKQQALQTAALKPELLEKIMRYYNRGKLPSGDFFRNTLERTFGVPHQHTGELAELLVANAEFVGILEDVSGSKYVLLDAVNRAPGKPDVDSTEGDVDDADDADKDGLAGRGTPVEPLPPVREAPAAARPVESRVFISHGKNRDIVEQIKTMLGIADFKFEVAVETEATAIPVPDKIISAMRACDAAIICVTADPGAEDQELKVNENVLIEIGAAFVLYDKRVILVWDKRLPVPSNLQGLYRCEIEGGELSWSKGMKLLAAIKKFRGDLV